MESLVPALLSLDVSSLAIWPAVPLFVFGAFVVGCGKKRGTPAAARPNKSKKGASSQKSVKGKSSTKSAKSNRSAKSKRSDAEKKGASEKKSVISSVKSAKSAKLPSERKSSRSSCDEGVKTARQISLREKQAPAVLPINETYAAKGLESEKYARSSLKTAREVSRSERKSVADLPSVPAKTLQLAPEQLVWKPVGGTQNVVIRNNTAERQAVKVKCSDNGLYRVNPVYAFVEAHENLKLDVVRQSGAPKIDKLVLVTAEASPTDTQPQQLFKKGSHPMMVLPLLAAEANSVRA